MGLVLRAGISFCEVSDRLLFLDIVADRYFCLGGRAEQAFRALIGRDSLNPEQSRALAGLVRSGMLAETTDEQIPDAVRAPCGPSDSLLDAPARRVGASHLAAALSTLTVTRLSLRFGHLHAVLNRLAELKPATTVVSEAKQQILRDAAAAFDWTARFVRSHDQCLSRSIALTRRLSRLGVPADLVIGVRLRPFAAHSWVQADAWLVNDRFDTVRTYTPILSV